MTTHAALSRSLLWCGTALLAVTLGGLAGATFAAEEPPEPPADEQQIWFQLGVRSDTVHGSLRRVAEYENVNSDITTGFHWNTSPYAKTWASIDFFRLDTDDQQANVEVDWKRVLEFHSTLDVLPHRLDHDPLTNQQAVSDIKVVRSTDFEPGREYAIRYRDVETGIEYQPVRASWFSVRGAYRDQSREGTRQHLNLSHCTSCHTTARGRDVDERTQDYTIGLHAWDRVAEYDYELLYRSFESDAGRITAPFERAYRPASPMGPTAPLPLPFNDRLWFQDGDFEVGRIPDVERLAQKFKVKADFNDAGRFAATLVQSKTENQSSGLDYEFIGSRVRYSWQPKEKMRVHLGASYDELDADDVLVDLTGPAYPDNSEGVTSYPGFGGPLTFQEWRALVAASLPSDSPQAIFDTPDFSRYLRKSSLDRQDLRVDADLWWRPMRRGSARVGYRYRMIDRDNVYLADGTGETESQRLKVTWNQRVAKRMRWNTTLTLTETDNPYVNDSGALRRYLTDSMGNTAGVAGSPKAGTSLQYYELHQLRVANLGNAATDRLRFRTQATYAPSPFWSLSANARYSDADNDELNFSDWNKENVGVGASIWIASGPKFQCTLGVDHQQETTETFFVVPVMDG